jgi:hypothetical protein
MKFRRGVGIFTKIVILPYLSLAAIQSVAPAYRLILGNNQNLCRSGFPARQSVPFSKTSG